MSRTATTTYNNHCAPATCRPNCALEIVDQLLRAHGTVRGDEVDSLLDFRSLLHRRTDAEAVLSLFCTLRRSMEERHYLSFYRLRRWLENHLQASVRVSATAPTRTVSLRLNNYCVEAIRSGCILQARRPGEPLVGSRILFTFAEPVPVIPSCLEDVTA